MYYLCGAYNTNMQVVSDWLKALLLVTSSGATCVSLHEQWMVKDMQNSG